MCYQVFNKKKLFHIRINLFTLIYQTSLLPYAYHPMVAQICIKYKVNMVTASYLSKQMQELNEA